MAVEYLNKTIIAEAGNPLSITAEITDEAEDPITSGCVLHLYDNAGAEVVAQAGIYDDEAETWAFSVEAAKLKGKGRYWYQITHDNNPLDFKTPLYFV